MFWSFSSSFSPSNECSGLTSFRMDWFDLLTVQWTLKSPGQRTVKVEARDAAKYSTKPRTTKNKF